MQPISQSRAVDFSTACMNHLTVEISKLAASQRLDAHSRSSSFWFQRDSVRMNAMTGQQVQENSRACLPEHGRCTAQNHVWLPVAKGSRFSLASQVRILFPLAPVQPVHNLIDALGHRNLLHLLVVLEADLRSRQRSEGPSPLTCTQAKGLLYLYIMRQDVGRVCV